MQADNNPDKTAAHILWVELSTRITTQRLHYRSGEEETAVASVRQLFTQTRELMLQYPEARAFQLLAFKLLNNTLRPYTARWHLWMTQSKTEGNKLVFKGEQVRRMFRTELLELQEELKLCQQELGTLAEVSEEMQKAVDESYSGHSIANLGEPIVAGLLASSEIIKSINDQEQQEILARRKVFNSPAPDAPLINATGLALSGGGIRSATFCLGIVQTLAKKKLFHPFDYLSTVSGGGYLGSFLSSTLADTQQPAPDLIDEVLNHQDGKDSQAVRHLRNSSKYLGTGGIQWMAGLMVFGILTNLLLLLPVPLFLAIVAYVLQLYGFWDAGGNTDTLWFGLQPSCAGWWLKWILVGLLSTGFILPFVESITHGNHTGKLAGVRSSWEKITLFFTLAAFFSWAIYALPKGFQTFAHGQYNLVDLNKNIGPMLATTVLPFFLAYGAKLLNAWGRVQKIVLRLFVLSGPLFFGLVFLLAGSRMGLGVITPHQNKWPLPHLLGDNWPVLVQHSDAIWIAIIAFLLLIWGWWSVNINTTSPYRYYRNRLCECYLLNKNNGKVEPRTYLPLTELSPQGSAAPYHLINTTLNLTTSKNPELRGRNGDFFMFSKYFCGSPVLGYTATKDVVSKNPHIDLGSAMAISGAAASTNMGWQSIARFRFWMGLMNIRLGYWLLNPKEKVYCKYLEGPGPKYLYKEIFGRMKETDRYLNLSDGGHIENLAVYELLRRKCKFIVSVDAGHEPGMECADLIRLQRYAEIDLGIRMEYDITDLQLNDNKLSCAYAILVKIIYSNADKDNTELGWMLYIKLAMTGTEPAYVTDYRRENPTFPHQTTGDQFFDEAQFEAYRMLGECAAESLFRSELLGGDMPDSLEHWFQALANNLLMDNDEAFKCTKPSPVKV